MPSQINNPGNLTDVAANYRKAFAPFTLFGTRQLRFYFIYIDNLNVNHPDNGGDNYFANAYESPFGGPDGWDGPQYQPNFATDSIFARVISVIQTQAELYGVWHPESDDSDPDDNSYFTVMVAGDTHADDGYDDVGIGPNSQRLEDAIYDVLDGTSCNYVDVRQAYISGTDLDEDSNSSLQRGAAPVALSAEDQAKADAVKAARVALKEAQKAARPARPAK
jgi:hypothetical protein